ncbi:hypothetical protein ACWCPC_32120, partial [Streptomyces decoyicus]
MNPWTPRGGATSRRSSSPGCPAWATGAETGRRGPGRGRSPTAPPRSFLWTRRIFLTALAGFVLLP